MFPTLGTQFVSYLKYIKYILTEYMFDRELTILLREQATTSNLLMNIKTTTERWKTKKGEKSGNNVKLNNKENGKNDLSNGMNIKIGQRRYGEYGGYIGYNNEPNLC